MSDPSGIAAALVAFQAEMPTVHKGKTANVGTYSYKYADLADIVQTATPILHAHGLSFSAMPRRTDAGTYELVGMLRHTSGESDEGALPLNGRSAQEIGSAITYARRYLMGCLTGIVTDDDEDGQIANRATSPTRSDPAPLVMAQNRVLAAWTTKHGLTPDDPEALNAIAEDYASHHNGANVMAATVPQLIAYAETLEAAK